jgi:hypothetical protein
VGGNISSASESRAPFNRLVAGSAEIFFFFEPEILRATIRFAGLGATFRFAFAFLGRFILTAFFGDGRAPRRACFLE